MASKKKTKKCVDTTVITMVVDESGSMAHLAEATMAGFNEYVTTVQKKLKEQPAYFSAITFDTRGIRKLQVGAKLWDAIKLTPANYQPTGGTPLLDAIGSAIAATDQVMLQEKAKKAIVVIQTDGEENSSREQNLAGIKALIEARQGQGWQFVFIGAGINAFADAQKMGIHSMNTMSYQADAIGTRSTFGATAGNTANYASGLASSMNYTQAQSRASGEDKKILRAKMFAAGKGK
jgi:hypothetical protein